MEFWMPDINKVKWRSWIEGKKSSYKLLISWTEGSLNEINKPLMENNYFMPETHIFKLINFLNITLSGRMESLLKLTLFKGRLMYKNLSS